jgi:hypothetical protein
MTVTRAFIGGLFLGLVIAIFIVWLLSFSSMSVSNNVRQVEQNNTNVLNGETIANLNIDPNTSLYREVDPAPELDLNLNPVMEGDLIVGQDPTSSLPQDNINATKDSLDDLISQTLGRQQIPQNNRVFYVQTGAYTKQADAEDQVAQLALIGFKASIVTKQQDGRVLYRVRSEPYQDRQKAAYDRDRLLAAGKQAIIFAQ